MPLTDTKTSGHRPGTATSSARRAPPRPGPRPRARGDLGSEPVERLEAEVIDLSARLAAGTYELLVLVGELDHRGSWATWGALSCAAWLADCCDIDVATARTQVRVARAMRQFPALDQAMASGDVSYAKARVLAAYLTPPTWTICWPSPSHPGRAGSARPSRRGPSATTTPTPSAAANTRPGP
jgi:hypothetical protein